MILPSGVTTFGLFAFEKEDCYAERMKDFNGSRDSEAPSFLQQLLTKRAAVLRMAETSGKSMDAALREVDRQIVECLRGRDPVGGTGVTKSGEEQ